jgi:hypothetical protein
MQRLDESLRAHEAYLADPGRAFDPAGFLRERIIPAAHAMGAAHAVAFEQPFNLLRV